jgi:phage-related protein
LKKFPEEVKDEVGYILYLVQIGKHHKKIKRLKGLSSVMEIVSDFDKDTYRTVYIAKLGNTIYVLHAFKKKSKRGIKTPQEDMKVIKQRLKSAQEIAEGK